MRVTQPGSLLPPIRRGQQINVTVNGRPVTAFAGETIAAVLLAEQTRVLRRSTKTGAPRGLFCGSGICFDCLVTVDDRPNIRACLTPVANGMSIETETGGNL
jgi:aerobic-type carbon monoxide dehydrogenase small subunit (CoxS/CutS family)